MKSYLFSLFTGFFLFFGISSFASADQVMLEYFGREDCKHCQDQKAFLEKIQPEYPQLSVQYYDVNTEEGKAFFNEVTGKAELSKTTPLTFVGNTFVQGFRSDDTTGERLKQLIQASVFKDTLTLEEYLKSPAGVEIESVAGGSCSDDSEECLIPEDSSMIFDIPLIGAVNLKEASLMSMSLVLGLIDGFNPCAMWVLLMFVMVLAQAGSKIRMLQIAGAFILAETIMYYLILNVWMTAWDFVGLDKWITPIVGLIAIGGGFFFLYEAKTSDGTCKVTNIEQRKKISIRVKELAENPLTWVTFLGVVGLAFSVNIIEFACSIGIPQTFTKVLDLNVTSWLLKQWYMLWYIIMYMFDDFIVFGIAIYSFEKLGVMTKYSRISNLIGGIIMLIIGILMIFKPELLVL